MTRFLLSLLTQKVPMADAMRSEGKIYVVLLGILVIFAGIALYLWLLDRKVQRMSKKIGPRSSAASEEQ